MHQDAAFGPPVPANDGGVAPSARTGGAVRYLILGATEVRDDRGRTLPLQGPRLRALLAALALRAHHTAPVPVATLIDDIWAEEPPADAPAALQALVGRLRRVLGATAILSAPGGYRLAAGPESIDLFSFEGLVDDAESARAREDHRSATGILRQALGLWRGPALADLPHAQWAAVRPQARRTAALHLRIDSDLALGRAAVVLPELRALTAEQPLDEPSHALLIRALRDTGCLSEALETYAAVSARLVDQYGTSPGPELRRLHAELLATPAPDPPPVRTSPGNIRHRLTSFVGREHDLTSLSEDLARARLVTLTGPGGSGKTRLAEHAARAAEGRYPDGTWIAELAPLEDPASVPGAVLTALGRRTTVVLGGSSLEAGRGLGQDHHDTATRLLDYCAGRRLLLILDNCEHLVTAAAVLAENLLAECFQVTILATSREPLGVPGELVRPVEPLAPAPAHRLFTERGTSARRGFDAGEDPEAIAEICRRLDGLPLAIELAAARLRSLTPRQIAGRLDNRFRLLSSGSRTVLPRQQTLRAVVDWSWDLLEERERTVLRRLSVFAGGCVLSAAEAVCADTGPGGAPQSTTGARIASGDVLDVLASLVDKSILVADQPTAGDDLSDTGVRYRMLETIHEYAAERAAERPGDRRATETRHAHQLLTFVRHADPLLRTSAQLRWFARVEAELDNIRAALQRSIAAGDAETARGIVLGMGWFWFLRNHPREGAEWAERVIALDPDSASDDEPFAPGDPPRAGPAYLDRTELRLLWHFLSHDDYGERSLRDEIPLAHVSRAVAAFGADPPPAQSLRFPGLLWSFSGVVTGDYTDIAARLSRTLENARRHAGPWEQAVLLLFWSHLWVDMPALLGTDAPDLPELWRLAEQAGDRWLLAQTHGLWAEHESLRDAYDSARWHFEQAIRIGEEIGADSESPFFRARIAELSITDDNLDRVEQELARAMADAERLGSTNALTFTHFLSAELALYRGDAAEARRLHGLTATQVARGAPPPLTVGHALLTTRLLLLEGGPPLQALRTVRRALSYALDIGCARPLVAHVLLVAASALDALGADECPLALDSSLALRGSRKLTAPERREINRLRARWPARQDIDAAAPDPAGLLELLDRLLATDGGPSPPVTAT